MKEKPVNYNDFSIYRSELMGISALLIFVHHLTCFVKYPHFPGDSLLYTLNIGVEIFFLLSGIGLYYSLSKGPRYKDYIAKRTLNVYIPALIISIPLFICIDFVFGEAKIITFLSDIFGISYWYTDSNINWYIYWSMLFYLIYPLIFRLLGLEKKIRGASLAFTVFTCIAVFVFCIILNRFIPEIYNYFEIGFARIPIFIIGCYFGRLVYEKKKITWKYAAVSAAGIILWGFVKFKGFKGLSNHIPVYKSLLISSGLINKSFPNYYERLSQELLALSLLLVLTFLLKLIKSEKLLKVLKIFGSMSLETYLIHIAISRICILFRHGELLSLWQYALVLIATVIISYPASKLRKKITTAYTKKSVNA